MEISERLTSVKPNCELSYVYKFDGLCVKRCESSMQHVAAYCGLLQHVAGYCGLLQLYYCLLHAEMNRNASCLNLSKFVIDLNDIINDYILFIFPLVVTSKSLMWDMTGYVRVLRRKILVNQGSDG